MGVESQVRKCIEKVVEKRERGSGPKNGVRKWRHKTSEKVEKGYSETVQLKGEEKVEKESIMKHSSEKLGEIKQRHKVEWKLERI